MISFDDALARLHTVARPLGTERLALGRAAGRVLAGPVAARIDAPRFTVSTMDGYAVRGADIADAPVNVTVVGERFPGGEPGAALGPNECVRIFTGAPAPPGADRVVIQEVVRREGDRAHVATVPAGSPFLRARGSDFRRGDQLLAPGRLLGPRALMLVAGADAAEVEVFRRPRVALLATGDELAEPGAACDTRGKVPDSISVGIAALAEAWGAEVVARQRVGDDLQATASAAEAALTTADVVVVSGGASVGERDFAKAAFGALGLETIFAGVAIKPGRPVWLGRASGKLVLGLPGNPTSAYVTARLLLAPLLAGLGGRGPAGALAWRTAIAATEIPAEGDRETFLRARLTDDSPSLVEPLPNQDSGAQLTLAQAHVLVRRAAGAEALARGDPIEVLEL